MRFVADTHALLWWFIDSPKISPTVAKIFENCEKGETIIYIPSIVLAEALSIFEKKRVSFDFRKLMNYPAAELRGIRGEKHRLSRTRDFTPEQSSEECL
jgi:predicted nucleic acid-binding protein